MLLHQSSLMGAVWMLFVQLGVLDRGTPCLLTCLFSVWTIWASLLRVRGKISERISDILGIQSTSSLGKYLGIPIKSPGSSPQDFNFIMDRVKQKLAGWKANLLSLAGRAVLVQAASSTIPTYAMQCSYLPNRVLEGVDRVNRNFL